MYKDWRGAQMEVGSKVIVSPRGEGSATVEAEVIEIQIERVKVKKIRSYSVPYNSKETMWVKHQSLTVYESLPPSTLPTFQRAMIDGAKATLKHYEDNFDGNKYESDVIKNCENIIAKYESA